MIHYDSIADVCITVPANDDVKEGQLCQINTEGKLCVAPAGNRYDGKCIQVRNGFATLQIHGVITAKFTGSNMFCGTRTLVVDDNNKMQYAADGKTVLVLNVDDANKNVTFYL